MPRQQFAGYLKIQQNKLGITCYISKLNGMSGGRDKAVLTSDSNK